MTDRALFDAREALLSEGTGQPGGWRRTVSLVLAARELVKWTPASLMPWPSQSPAVEQPSPADNPRARLDAFLAVTAELTRRGLDAESLVRFGMRNEIMASVLVDVLLDALGLPIPEVVHPGIDRAGWRSALPKLPEAEASSGEVSAESLLRIVRAIENSHMALVHAWIMTAPLSDLITRSAPDFSSIEDASSLMPNSDAKLYQQYAWLVDRFSTTALRDWLTSSLHLEYRWQSEQEPPPCPTELMLDRDVDAAELSAEIARRSALNIGTQEPDPEAVLASEMTSHASALLEQGRYGDAAALFEFAVHRRPDDPGARNNLGFCLIPLNPQQALFELEAAARMGYSIPVINTYNRVCSYLAQRQHRAAIAAAENYWSDKREATRGATLWRWLEEGSWEITHVTDPHLALAELAELVCRLGGWREEALVWRRRAQSMRPAIPGARED
jgi:tetratricopeptide (TPR) repeat protein